MALLNRNLTIRTRPDIGTWSKEAMSCPSGYPSTSIWPDNSRTNFQFVRSCPAGRGARYDPSSSPKPPSGGALRPHIQGRRYTIGLSRFPDGTLAEAFIHSSKASCDLADAARDAAVTLSLALQFGTPAAQSAPP